jgi:hypothetical protein
MKKYIKQLVLVLMSTGAMLSCENTDFGKTNVNPNAPSEPNGAGFLTLAERTIGSVVTSTTGIIYTQQMSNITYTDESRYGTLNFDSDGFYTSPLINLKTIIDLNSNATTAEAQIGYGSNANQIAVSKILMAYFYQHMTDRWGMIPYSEALQGLDNTYPVFDTQEAIYDSLFTEIDEAIAMMDSGAGPTGDIIFNGDMARWEQFGKTLQLVMALRLSNVHPSSTGYAATKFKEAMTGAISSTEENIVYPFLSDDNNDNAWQDRFQTREDYGISDVLVDRLLADEDPRIEAYADYARTSVDNGVPEYIGMPYGLTNSEFLAVEISLPDAAIIYDGAFPGMIFSYAQVAFSYAEAVELGWISGDASAYYATGITSSFEQWGVEGAADYIATIPLSATATTAVQQIAEEKWKALYLQGYESWAEWRRLGYPELTPAVEPLNGSAIPVRNGYDTDLAGSNKDNYDAAVSTQGPDVLSTNIWWDAPHPITNK